MVEDYLSLEQLRDVRINVTVIRPLVDKFYELDDISISKCCIFLFFLTAIAQPFILFSNIFDERRN